MEQELKGGIIFAIGIISFGIIMFALPYMFYFIGNDNQVEQEVEYRIYKCPVTATKIFSCELIGEVKE